MTYRISYGNGQVSGDIETLAKAKRELALVSGDQYAADFRIERYEGEGDWCYLGLDGKWRLRL